MDQEEFRRLLANPAPGASRFNTPSTKKTSLDASKPAFQPRKVKKKTTESAYRDRASDRRAGINDYAEIESVLENFEKRTSEIEDRDVVEEQRRYLGGDKDHTILVKGLDFALLEQNKSRAVDSQKEDDSLEVAFQEAQSKSTLLRKRTREEIVKALKEKRALDGTQSLDLVAEEEGLEKAKQMGKFKPIGVPVTSNMAESKQGRGKNKLDDRPKKKKRKIAHSVDSTTENGNQRKGETSGVTVTSPPLVSLPAKELAESNVLPQILQSVIDPPAEPEEDSDIFADAGDYQGYDFEDEAHPTVPSDSQQPDTPASPILADSIQPKGWFDGDDAAPIDFTEERTPTPPKAPESGEQDQEEQTTRLAPLASSALPSIRDFLAVDTQVEARERRKAKKEKKRGNKKEKDSLDVKVNRDYQKLNSYMAKKK